MNGLSHALDPRIGGGLRWRRRASAVLAFAALLLAAIGLEASHEAQSAVAQALSGAARASFAEGGIVRLAATAVAAGLWLAWLVARILAFFAIFFVAETLLLGPPRDWRTAGFALAVQTALGLFYFAAAPLIQALLPLSPAPLLSLDQRHLAALAGPLAPVLIALAAMLCFNLLEYWLHRAQHRFAFLWRFHRVHHSIEDLDALNSYTHPIDLLGQRLCLMLMSALIGFRFDALLWILALQAIHDRLLHTRAPVNFGPLGAVFVDNRHHFLHHTIRAGESGRNFSPTFTLFDRLFGTYRAPGGEGLARTGLEDKRPPATLGQFLTGRLEDRVEAAS